MKYCILTKDCCVIDGYNRSLISDFTRERFYIIPKALSEVFNRKTIDIDSLFKKLDEEEKNIFTEYLKFLNQNELLIFSDSRDELERFKDIKLDFLTPLKITNAIIEESKFVKIDENLISQLTDIDIQNLEIRICHTAEVLKDLITLLKMSKVINLEIIVDFNIYKKFDNFWENNARIRRVFLYSSNFNKIEKSEITGSHLIFTKENYSNKNCGLVSVSYFHSNIPHFTESQLYNTCLNRKICIDSDGYIKNCPSMKHHYGHISDTTLAEAMEKPGFKDCWYIKKDDIDVCQDCEFRHICTDCRAFIKDPNNLYSQPAKCGYNPYVAKWQNEEAWISVEQWREENPNWEEQAIELRELNKKYMNNDSE